MRFTSKRALISMGAGLLALGLCTMGVLWLHHQPQHSAVAQAAPQPTPSASAGSSAPLSYFYGSRSLPLPVPSSTHTAVTASSPVSTPAVSTSATPSHHITAEPTHRAAEVSMQLHAHTSIGTGRQARAWALAIASKFSAHPSAADINSMLSWFSAEDDDQPAGSFAYGAGENNPLNLTSYSGDFPGVVGSEPSGAGPGHPDNLDFATPALGVAATVQVIEQYSSVAQALASGKGLIGNFDVSADLDRWSGGGYSSLS